MPQKILVHQALASKTCLDTITWFHLINFKTLVHCNKPTMTPSLQLRNNLEQLKYKIVGIFHQWVREREVQVQVKVIDLIAS